jgi:hypothetical protein
MSTSDLPPHCPNCQAQVFGPYCAQCGQETVVGKLRLRDFSHEYLQNFVTLEGRLWRSLWLLVSQPGQLTLEFLAGRRRRFVRPIPLYLSLSFLLFVLLALTPPTSLFQFDDAGTGAAAPAAISAGQTTQRTQSATSTANDKLPALEKLELQIGLPQWLKPLGKRYYKAIEQLNDDPHGASQRLLPAVLTKLPYAVFMLVPMFAVNTRLLYWRRNRGYAEHFLFALHLHAFVFLTFLVGYGLPPDSVAFALFWSWLIYLTLALRRFFGGRWWVQGLRALLLMALHAFLLAIALAFALVIALPSI